MGRSALLAVIATADQDLVENFWRFDRPKPPCDA